MKYLPLFTLSLIFATCFAANSQNRTVVIDGQPIVLMEGRKTDFSSPSRFIYRNDVDTAYALIVGHFYTTEEVKKAFGEPQEIRDHITKDLRGFSEGSISYTYEYLDFSINYDMGLCNFSINKENITFSDYDRNIKIGDNASIITDDPEYKPMVTKISVYQDKKTGKKCISTSINYTGDDSWIYYSFFVDESNGIDLTFKGIGFMEIN